MKIRENDLTSIFIMITKKYFESFKLFISYVSYIQEKRFKYLSENMITLKFIIIYRKTVSKILKYSFTFQINFRFFKFCINFKTMLIK